MPIDPIDESGIRFTFDEREWKAVTKWDEHAQHRQGLLQRVNGTKAVDIIAIQESTSAPWLFEMKNFRGPRGEIARREHDLSTEVPRKLSDTLASMLWANGRPGIPADERVTRVLKAALHGSTSEDKVHIVVWVDEAHSTPQRVSNLAASIKKAVRPWLNADVLVTNIDLWNNAKGIRAENLPDAHQPVGPGNP
jgi:hypothetical protein